MNLKIDFEKFFRNFLNQRPCSVSRRAKSSGFTLIEILIVITLIGLIGTFAIKNYTASLNEGKQKISVSKMRELQSALDDYYRTCNHYPTTGQGGLEALYQKPTTAPECKNYNPEGYIKGKKIPTDGWDNPYIYINEDGSKNYTLKSLGADGKEGGADRDKDLDINDPDRQ